MPPFVGAAVNVTAVPEHMSIADAAIVTDGISAAPTFIVMVFEYTVLGLAQLKDDSMATLITSPLCNVET